MKLRLLSNTFRPALLFLLCLAAVHLADGQGLTLRGRVIDGKGQPVAGATVIEKGTRNGTITNEKGAFILHASDQDDSLIITSIGYQRQAFKPTGSSGLTVTLNRNSNKLDETIIRAYGTTTRRLNTGDISKVTAKEIERQPVSNPLAALEGRVPGLVVTQSSGVPGASFKVQIRGQNSIAQGSDPLFIIDGVPFTPGNNSLNQIPSAANNPLSQTEGGLSPFNLINPSDIQSIEVLKDADATAIYGSRGANGVILITTKKGKAGKTKFNINGYSGISTVTRTMKMLNTSQYLQMRREAFKNDQITPTTKNAPDLTVWDTTRNTNWADYLIGGTAHTSDVQGSISGGDNNTQFLISSSYHHETTVFPGDMAENRGTVGLNLTHSSRNNKFNSSVSANYSSNVNNISVKDLSAYLDLPPDFPKLIGSDGKLTFSEDGVAFSSLSLENPLTYLFEKYTGKIENLIGNARLSYHLLPYLTFKTSVGYNSVHTNETSIRPSASLDPQRGLLPSAKFANSFSNSWIVEPQLEFNKTINKLKIDFLLGGTWQKQEDNSTSISASGYSSDLLLHSVEAASSFYVDNGFTQYNYNAFFGRLNLNWLDRYILNLSARRDGSSRFGPGKRFSNFGAAGLAWLFSESRILKKIPWLSYGKLRVSYGTTGNDQIGDYMYLDSWTSYYFQYDGQSGLIPSRLFNPDFSWEVNRKMEAGLDLGLFKDRILLDADYFYNRSGNQLIPFNLPAITGFYSIVRNFPALVQNTGLEIDLTSQNVKSAHFSWSTRINMTLPHNKLVAFPGLSTSSYASSLVIGQSLNVIYAYKSLGVDPKTGVYIFKDKNGDGVLNSKDQYVEGNVDPKFYGGIENDFRYKNFQIGIFIAYRKQKGLNYLASQTIAGYSYNQPVQVLKRWQAPGDHTNIGKFVSGPGSPAFLADVLDLPRSSAIYSDASFIRLKSLFISYQIPADWLKGHLAGSSIYIKGQNLFTLTDYLGSDPETQNLYILPPLKTIVAGVHLTF